MTRDRLIAATFLCIAWGEQVSGGREQLALNMALAALMTAPLGFAVRRPWLPAAAGALGMVAYGLMRQEPDAMGEILGLVGAVLVAGSRLSLRDGLLAASVIAAGAAVNLAFVGPLADLLFIVGVFVVPPFLLGRAIQARRERIEELRALNRELSEQRERSAHLAAEIERARITRDVEAVVAASLNEMIEHARRGETLAEPGEAGDAFEAIRATGAEATAELRRLLRLLQA